MKSVLFYDRIIKTGLALLLVSVPLFFIYYHEAGIYFSIYEQAKEALAQGLILILFCAWLLKMNSRDEFHSRRNPLILPILIFFAVMCFSLIWATNPYEGLLFIRRWASHILLYFIIINNVRGLKEILSFMPVMIFTAVIVAVYGILQYYGWEFSELYQVITLNSTTGNPNFAAAYLAGVMPLGLCLWMYTRGKKKIFVYFATLIIFIHLAVTNSRASWVGLITALAVLVVLSFRKKVFLRMLILGVISIAVITHFSLMLVTPQLMRDVGEKVSHLAHKMSPAGAGSAGGALSVPGTAPSLPESKPGVRALPEIEQFPFRDLIKVNPQDPWWKKRFASIFNPAYATNRQRIEIWKGTAAMVKAHPLFGVGIGNFSLVYPRYQTRAALATYDGSAHFIRHAHNEYFQFAAELGLVGLAVFIWFAFLLVKGLLRRIKTAGTAPSAVIYLGLLGSVLAALVAAGFGFNLQNESSALYFWFVVGLATANDEND